MRARAHNVQLRARTTLAWHTLIIRRLLCRLKILTLKMASSVQHSQTSVQSDLLFREYLCLCLSVRLSVCLYLAKVKFMCLISDKKMKLMSQSVDASMISSCSCVLQGLA